MFRDRTMKQCPDEAIWVIEEEGSESGQAVMSCTHHLGYLLDEDSPHEYVVSPIFVLGKKPVSFDVGASEEVFHCPVKVLNDNAGDEEEDYWVLLDSGVHMCSHCSSLHPDDAARLVKHGWKLSPYPTTVGAYKLHPPEGTSVAFKNFRVETTHFEDRVILAMFHECFGGKWELDGEDFAEVNA